MSLPALAPVSGLEVRLGLAVGSISGADLARAQAALVDVSAIVRQEAGMDWIDPDDPTAVITPDTVAAVVLQAVKRAYENPENLSQESLGGDYASTKSLVGIYLTEDEKTIVRIAADGGRKNITGTVRTPSAYFDPKQGFADPGLLLWGLE